MKKTIAILFLFTITFSGNAQFRKAVEMDNQVLLAKAELPERHLVSESSIPMPAIDRVLTNEEKQILQGNSAFIYECQWALKNYASYWPDASDATAKIASVGAVPWAKNYIWASRTLENISTIDNNSQIPLEFAVLLKGMNLWDNAVTPFNATTVVNYMIANGRFDELATAWVTSKTVKPSF